MLTPATLVGTGCPGRAHSKVLSRSFLARHPLGDIDTGCGRAGFMGT